MSALRLFRVQAGEATDSTAGLLGALRMQIGGLSVFESNLIKTVALVFLLMSLRWLILFAVRRRATDARTQYYWRKAVTYTVAVIGLFAIGRLWFAGVGSLATFFGLVGAGLALALKDPVVNLAGWLFILWRRPFRVGDRVQIGNNAGDVIDQRLFQFTLLEIGNWVDADQSTGRLIHIPNGVVFTTPLANYTRGFPYIWNELPVQVTYESNWEKAKKILHEIADERGGQFTQAAEREILAASRHYMIFYSTLRPTVYTSVADSGVVLTIRYLCDARRRRGSAQDIWEDVLRAFAKHDDIDLAYPTTRFFDNAAEGKPPLRPRDGE
ncbi:MAG TPA: mechanosensitive ion channel family protein [Longimicrobiales bacterium]|nr:mechanosensitive ion channel family protein [Longimicrobiales bacterium]